MSRPLRIELAGGLYHVTSRGNRREDIYMGDADRLAWLEILAQVCKRCNWRVHAWCQMTNHYHLVVETVQGNLSLGMRQLNGVYTQTVNRTHGRVGHVFQGRFRGILVDKDSYLLELARYVVLNPVRARMVRDTARWAWSSYHAMTGAQPAPAWLQTDWLLAQFSNRRARAVERYIEFVRQGVGLPAVWENLRGQVFLGDDAFLKRMQKHAGEAASGEIPRAQRRPVAKPLSYYEKKLSDRDQAIAAAYATGDYTMQQIAQHFEVHYATVSRAIRRAEE
jgi:REP element-mobilizing transposase RayT